MSARPRSLLVCADDYGLNDAIDEAVIRLGGRGRLGATSCITTLARWPAAARRLQSGAPGLLRGLHFNLTEGVPLSGELRRVWPCFPRLTRLMLDAALERLPLLALRAEWQAQHEAFVQALGHRPEYVDGHQHVHQLPGVRQLVLAAVRAQGTPVRNTAQPLGPGDGLKRLALQLSGGHALGRLLARRGLAQNEQLVGIYDFRDADYAARLRGWMQELQCRPGRSLLVCHPAAPALSRSHTDPISEARVREWAALGAAEFGESLQAYAVVQQVAQEAKL